jgi:hypothetical protein
MAKLTAAKRSKLKSSSFIFPGQRKYPIPDESHARNALSRVSQHGSPALQAKVRAAVHKKYPGIGKADGGKVEGEKCSRRMDRR